MKWKLEDLKREVIRLLDGAGFPLDHYVIKTADDYVAVFFDMKEAVEYFRLDFDSSKLAKDCFFEYRKEGKRHGAYIRTW